jgi:RNA polymerase sigma factor for flagellar operon FliA
VTTTEAYGQVADKSRRDELVLSHLPLVRHVLGKLAAQFPPGTDTENLESAGVLGLVEAAAHFDPERNAQFKTYAYIRIRGAILDELRRNCPLPQQVLEAVARVQRAYNRLPLPVTVEALAAATGMGADEVADCLAAIRLTRTVSWELDREPLRTRLDGGPERPEAALERAELRQRVAAAIEALPPRERLVVTLYYREDLRLREISSVMGLSESRVSRLLNAALFALGEYFRARE